MFSQVNTVSTALLGALLLPKLKASKSQEFTPVLELVSSGNHYYVDIDPKIRAQDDVLEAASHPYSYSPFAQYDLSKLFLMVRTPG